MIYLKDKPVGVDIQIQLLQKWLFGKLKTNWSLTGNNDFQFYGRVYKNNSEKGYIPEVFNSSLVTGNTQYDQVYFDETNNKAVLFFHQADNVAYANGSSSTTVSLICLLNISTLKVSLYRTDEEVKLDLMQLLHSGRYGFELKSIETGVKHVTRDFTGWMKSNDELTFSDRHPLYCFRVNFNLLYDLFDNK